MHLHNSTPAPISKTLNRHHILSLIAGQYLSFTRYGKTPRLRLARPSPLPASKPKRSPPSFRPLPSDLNIDHIFVIKETRGVNKDNSFSFRGTTYFIPEKHHAAGCKVDVRLANDYLRVYHQGTFLIELKVN